MSNKPAIVPLTRRSVANQLRDIADDIDAGKHAGESATLVIDCDIYGLGTNTGNPQGVVFDMNMAIAKITGITSQGYDYKA